MILKVRFFALFFIVSQLFAELVVNITPEIVFQGSPFLINVISDKSPKGNFDGKEIFFKKVEDKKYVAISCAPLKSKVGFHYLYISNVDSSLSLTIKVLKRVIPKREITLPERMVSLKPKEQERVKEENRRLAKLWSKVSEPLWKGDFVSPLQSEVISPFAVLRILNKKGRSIHKGLDYKGKTGEPVKAINSGIVVFKGDLLLPGKTVIIDHGGGIFSLYMHLSGFNCDEKQIVKKREVIGFVGSTGRSSGAHLHLSVKINGFDVDPQSLFLLEIPEEKK
ncbi:MAG: M23 family metallopeptidase [Candidatus Aminicenantia bacterium]